MEGKCNQTRSEEATFDEEFKSLMTLIETGNVKDVTEFLDKYTKDRYVALAQKSQLVVTLMFQAVHKAASLGHVEVMDALVFHGFNHDSEDYPELPPLHTACAAGHLDVVKSLVQKHGVSPDEEDPVNGVTPLLAALRCPGNSEVIEFLLSAGASTNRQSRDETGPLVFAAEECSPETCELLLSHGADVNARDEVYDNPLCASVCADKFSNAVCLLEAGADVNLSRYDMFNGTPFQIATNCDNLLIMRLLHSHGACSEYQDYYGNTPLHCAAANGTYEIAKYLAVEIGVEKDISNCDAKTPFVLAVENGNIDIADMLVKSGYNPKQEELVFDEDELMLDMAGMDKIKTWKQMLSVPRRLQDLCIFLIRCYIRNQWVDFSLPLPQHLIDEIVMHER